MEDTVYKMQYRFYKYVVSRCEGVIEVLETEDFTASHIKPWIAGFAEDLRTVLPLASQDETDGMLKTIETANTKEDALKAARELLKVLKNRFEVFLRIDVLFGRPQSATHLIPIYQELSKDRRVWSVCVARGYVGGIGRRYLYDFYDKLKEAMDGRVEYIEYPEYDIQKVMPDIVVHTEVHNGVARPIRLAMMSVKSYIKRIVFVEHSLSPNDVCFGDPRNSAFVGTWLDCCASEYIWQMRRITRGHDMKNSQITGHPLMDIGYNMYSQGQKPERPVPWQKVICDTKPKAIILWCTSYFKKWEFEWLEQALCEHSDVLIICRPHPEMLRDEFNYTIGVMNELDSKYPNLIIDRYADHSFSLSIADAYIGGTGTLYQQYATSGRPGIVFLDNEDYKNTYINRWTHVNTAKKRRDIIDFIQAVKTGQAVKCDEENEMDRYFMGLADGKSCERIHDAILAKLRLEDAAFIGKYCAELSEGE